MFAVCIEMGSLLYLMLTGVRKTRCHLYSGQSEFLEDSSADHTHSKQVIMVVPKDVRESKGIGRR